MKCSIFCIPTASPADLNGLKKLIIDGQINPHEVISVIGKTEGNGCVNDFTRGFSVEVLKNFFESQLHEKVDSKISFVMSGGTEGVLSPHLTVICRSEHGDSTEADRKQKALSVGVARTETILPEYLGRMEQVKMVAAAVQKAMKDAGIDNPQDVHFVQIKCPLLTAPRIKQVKEKNGSVVTEDTYKSMGYSRGASALGVAVALGEIEVSSLRNEDICHSFQYYSNVASTSAGIELMECEIVVFGNSLKASGDLFIEHEVMKDAIDAQAVQQLLEKADGAKVIQVLAKAEADPSGFVRGRRHTMMEDSDINHTRHARAVVGGVIASLVGDPMIYVSGGAEHQGPSGGGPIAAVFRRG
jgi:cyanuric acid amidohydrolase